MAQVLAWRLGHQLNAAFQHVFGVGILDVGLAALKEDAEDPGEFLLELGELLCKLPLHGFVQAVNNALQLALGLGQVLVLGAHKAVALVQL